jgi:hypothetical protein
MDEAEREKLNEFQRNFGPREFFRLGCFIMVWNILGVIIAIVLAGVFHKEEPNPAVIAVFVLTIFAFPLVAPYWKPANSLFNFMLGNKKPAYPLLHQPSIKLDLSKRPWCSFLPTVWRTILLIILLSFVIKYLSK